MRMVLPIKSGITTGKRAHPKNITTPHCQGQHTELDRLPILSSACHGETSRKALQKDGLRSPGWCLPGEECGGHGHGNVQAPLTTHCSPTPNRARDKTTERAFIHGAPLTASTEPGYSGTAALVTCGAGSGWVVWKREERRGWKWPSCPGNPKTFQKARDSAEGPAFKS